MSRSYHRNGIGWLIASGVIAVATIIGLVFLIINTANLFGKDSYWFNLLKDTALLTVITSVAIYILRITVKLALSSLHLSRDAKEREQLSYFYLALIESKGITNQERISVINALFSRSDTGLLKGDSAPTLPTGITDVIEKVNNSECN